MSAPLDEEYLVWLYGQVHSTRLKDPTKTFWSLLRQLYITEFVWLVPNDDNRVEDGRDLRAEFLDEHDIQDKDPDWLGLGCSMLELVLGLSRRLEFQTDQSYRDWFWHILHNLDLAKYDDERYDEENPHDRIEDILSNVIWRQYKADGSGGLFPLDNPEEDQREVEIWYQLCAYILDRF